VNFFCKLLPPRPSFAQDMSPEERALMQQHAGYWQEWIGRGHVIAFGLVADPAGPFGIGIMDFATEADVRAFMEGDPTIQAGAGFRFEVHPMPMGVVTA
jgi:hypothetical protein